MKDIINKLIGIIVAIVGLSILFSFEWFGFVVILIGILIYKNWWIK